MEISEIPMAELEKDLEDSIQDIFVCKLALLLGQTTYGVGESVEERIQANEGITEKIRTEIARRSNES
jgi:hypothetical protein